MADSNEDRGDERQAGGGRGFRVSDRRGQAKEEPPSEKPRPGRPEAAAPSGGGAGARPGAPPGRAEAPGEKAAAGEKDPAPPITFTTFVFSLSSSALVQLGEIPDPFTRQVEQNLTVAQQTIDLLGMLEEKTTGNLSEDEKKTLEAILYDLRLRFLKASGRI
jgi:hypothetical protein